MQGAERSRRDWCRCVHHVLLATEAAGRISDDHADSVIWLVG